VTTISQSACVPTIEACPKSIVVPTFDVLFS
jgi:hypothetical protein